MLGTNIRKVHRKDDILNDESRGLPGNKMKIFSKVQHIVCLLFARHCL